MSNGSFPADLVRDVANRRTFAIISHPDAGKTTLTEKLLLFGGAIQLAGTVKARKSSRHATSDWMEIEKQRGISVTSSVMQFEYAGHTINLLDTPGHEDFSEDTYRVLTAVDAAVMVIDAAKGVEAQTIKLLDVCRLRSTPIITFVNKMDREVRDGLALIEEIESVLKIDCASPGPAMPTAPDIKSAAISGLPLRKKCCLIEILLFQGNQLNVCHPCPRRVFFDSRSHCQSLGERQRACSN